VKGNSIRYMVPVVPIYEWKLYGREREILGTQQEIFLLKLDSVFSFF